MFTDIPASTMLGRAYIAWYKRTCELEPRIVTTCHIRLIAIYQLLYVLRTFRVLGTRVRGWMLWAIAIFVLLCALFPTIMVVLLIAFPLTIILCVVIAAVLYLPLRLLKPVFIWIKDNLRLDEWVSTAVDTLIRFKKWVWTGGRAWRIGVVAVFVVLISTLEIVCYISIFAKPVTLLSILGSALFFAIFTVQTLLVLIILLGVCIFLQEEYRFFTKIAYRFDQGREKVGLISPTELSNRYPPESREAKPHGLYKRLFMDTGLCKYAKVG